MSDNERKKKKLACKDKWQKANPEKVAANQAKYNAKPEIKASRRKDNPDSYYFRKRSEILKKNKERYHEKTNKTEKT